MGSEQTGEQAFLRVASSGDARSDIGLEFGAIMWRGSGSVLADLSPDVLSWIELGCGLWKVVNN